MFKKFNKIMLAAVTILGIGAFTPTVTSQADNIATSFSIPQATTNRIGLRKGVASDGPWETIGNTNDSDSYNYYEQQGFSLNTPLVEETYNGNEISYGIAPNDPDTKYIYKAVNAWNKLGVIKLVQTNYNDPNTEITISHSNTYNKYADGNTTTGENKNNITNWNLTSYSKNSQENTMQHANIIIYKQSSYDKTDTITHELGHALGFAHDNRFHNNYNLTMSADNDTDYTYHLGGLEQRMLSRHYNIMPAHWITGKNQNI